MHGEGVGNKGGGRTCIARGSGGRGVHGKGGGNRGGGWTGIAMGVRGNVHGEGGGNRDGRTYIAKGGRGIRK